MMAMKCEFLFDVRAHKFSKIQQQQQQRSKENIWSVADQSIHPSVCPLQSFAALAMGAYFEFTATHTNTLLLLMFDKPMIVGRSNYKHDNCPLLPLLTNQLLGHHNRGRKTPLNCAQLYTSKQTHTHKHTYISVIKSVCLSAVPAN